MQINTQVAHISYSGHATDVLPAGYSMMHVLGIGEIMGSKFNCTPWNNITLPGAAIDTPSSYGPKKVKGQSKSYDSAIQSAKQQNKSADSVASCQDNQGCKTNTYAERWQMHEHIWRNG